MVNILTKKQANLLEQIKAYISSAGIPPTVRELCDLVGINSTSTIAGHLNALQKKGYISKNPNSPRSIRVIKP